MMLRELKAVFHEVVKVVNVIKVRQLNSQLFTALCQSYCPITTHGVR